MADRSALQFVPILNDFLMINSVGQHDCHDGFQGTLLTKHQVSNLHFHFRLTRPFVLTFSLMHAICLSLSEILWQTVASCLMLKVDVFLGDLLKVSTRCEKI